MNLTYHLTVKEARDGLDGIYPLKNKSALRISGLFIGLTGALVLYLVMTGWSWRHFWFAIACAIVSGWFFFSRKISITLVGGRATGDYRIMISREGWLKSGKKEEKIKFTKDAYGAETKLTISFKPDENHMYVVPKASMTPERQKELMDLLDEVKCPVKRLGESSADSEKK